jgi:hypothetical protein
LAEAVLVHKHRSSTSELGNSYHSLGHALRRNAAGAFGPDLAKKLTQLVKMEKNVMRSLELVAKERMEVAVRSLFPLVDLSSILKLTLYCSNNYRSGVSTAMKTSPMSPTSSVFCSTKSVNSKTNMLTATTSIV